MLCLMENKMQNYVCVAGKYTPLMLNLMARIYNSKIIQLKVCCHLQMLIQILFF